MYYTNKETSNFYPDVKAAVSRFTHTTIQGFVGPPYTDIVIKMCTSFLQNKQAQIAYMLLYVKVQQHVKRQEIEFQVGKKHT